MRKLGVVFGTTSGYLYQAEQYADVALKDAEIAFNKIKEHTPNIVVLSVQYHFEPKRDEVFVTCILTYIKM